MAEVKKVLRLVSVAKDLNVGTHTIIEHLNTKGFDIENKPTVKLTEEMYNVLIQEFKKDVAAKQKAEKINLGHTEHEDISIDQTIISSPRKMEDVEEVLIQAAGVQGLETEKREKPKGGETEKTKFENLTGTKVVGKVELKKKEKVKEKEKIEEEEKEAPEKEEVIQEPEDVIEPTEKIKIEGPKVVGKIDLPQGQEVKPKQEKSEKTQEEKVERSKKKRKRFIKTSKISLRDGKQSDQKSDGRRTDPGRSRRDFKSEPQVSDKEIQEKIKATLAKLGGPAKGKSTRAKLKRQKKEDAALHEVEDAGSDNLLQVTEFISVSELASMMSVGPTDVISKCMELGIMVSINQRLDAEVIELVAGEFGYNVKFINISDHEEDEVTVDDDPEDLVERSPIVTVMGHVDHGKTSLLDFVRSANVISEEAGGITQHIGAYEVTTDSGKRVVFLDTPGHEAFTAMRARGAKVTDVAVIVIAADDSIMPQTKEAISHAQAAGVPMIFAINKIDKDGANPEKIKEQLAGMNLLVEDWGGKFQSQDISAKQGTNIDKLLDKILLEAELLELKANPNKPAFGTVIEASLDKGRGYLTTVLVQDGTLKMGDIVVSGTYSGKVKAMFNEKGDKLQEAGPSTAALILGLNGAPQAGELFKVYTNEQEAKQVTNKRDQIIREQGLRTKKHITLDEIGRRLALGTFKELNMIIKADVDGSVEALSDALLKLSTQEIVINVVHGAVGQITESDVLLASASDAVIIGFQVRPSVSARKLAEKENIEIRFYTVIYNAIEEIKTAMEGMLEPTIEEKITGNIEVKELFKVSKVGTIAGCQVIDGKVTNKAKVRIIRDGVVVFIGELKSLKRFKDEVKEVITGQECGIHVKDYNDVKVGDIIESYVETQVKRTL